MEVSTQELLVTLARSLNRKVDPGSTLDRGSRPGDAYAARTSWADILQPAGWEKVRQDGTLSYWRRPGKSGRLWSATTGPRGEAGDLLYIFSSSCAPFEPSKSYSKFAAYTLLNHGGDYAAAARVRWSAWGTARRGGRRATARRTSTGPGERPPSRRPPIPSLSPTRPSHARRSGPSRRTPTPTTAWPRERWWRPSEEEAGDGGRPRGHPRAVPGRLRQRPAQRMAHFPVDPRGKLVTRTSTASSSAAPPGASCRGRRGPGSRPCWAVPDPDLAPQGARSCLACPAARDSWKHLQGLRHGVQALLADRGGVRAA